MHVIRYNISLANEGFYLAHDYVSHVIDNESP